MAVLEGIDGGADGGAFGAFGQVAAAAVEDVEGAVLADREEVAVVLAAVGQELGGPGGGEAAVGAVGEGLVERLFAGGAVSGPAGVPFRRSAPNTTRGRGWASRRPSGGPRCAAGRRGRGGDRDAGAVEDTVVVGDGSADLVLVADLADVPAGGGGGGDAPATVGWVDGLRVESLDGHRDVAGQADGGGEGGEQLGVETVAVRVGAGGELLGDGQACGEGGARVGAPGGAGLLSSDT
ncbi:hypothetical protein [Kitasatospora griseola]|uniref:hypothetical protein n=1 Tax=Kitasatospora griseola TaxID=2064 RepID=UPI00342E83C1